MLNRIVTLLLVRTWRSVWRTAGDLYSGLRRTAALTWSPDLFVLSFHVVWLDVFELHYFFLACLIWFDVFDFSGVSSLMRIWSSRIIIAFSSLFNLRMVDLCLHLLLKLILVVHTRILLSLSASFFLAAALVLFWFWLWRLGNWLFTLVVRNIFQLLVIYDGGGLFLELAVVILDLKVGTL